MREETFKQRFERHRNEFDRDFADRERSIRRAGRFVKVGAITILCLSPIWLGVVVYVAAHFIAKFW
jgi:hypothetical protein